MPNRSTIASLALATLSGCGAGEPWESLGAADQPIIAGTLDTGDPAVVELLALTQNSVGKCTATLVTPRVLLTAGHCVAESPDATFRVFLGNDDDKLTMRDLLPVSAAVFDPQYGDVTEGHDLAVVVLASPLSITPIPINRIALTQATIGKTARYVGYGVTNGTTGTGDGVKRQASGSIDFINRNLIGMGANKHLTCNGDSGGPLFMDNGQGRETIIGVTSFGDETCVQSAYFMRMDTQVAWVDEQIKKYDPNGLPPTADAGAPPADAARPDAAVARDTRPDQSLPPDLVPVTPDPDPPVQPDAGPPGATKPDAARGQVDAQERALEEIPDGHMTTRGCSCSLGTGDDDRDAGGWTAGALLLFAVGARARRRRKA